MVIGRRVGKRKGQHLVALSPEVRARLGVIPGQWLYFHLGRKGEVVLSTSPARAGGKPPTAGLEEQLATAQAVVAELRQRGESRDRAMYAEGYALGRQDQAEMDVKPTGKRASELLRHRLRHRTWAARVPEGYVEVEKAAGRKRARPVEVVEAPVLVLPEGRAADETPRPDPSPSES